MADVPPTRASLLLRLRDSQDEEAWRQFVDRYAHVVYGYVRKQGLQDADASDVCQDVLAGVAGAVARLEYDPTKGAFRNWLFTIVRRKLANWRQAQAGRPGGSGDNAIQQLLEQHPAAASGEAEWEAEWQKRMFTWACEQARREHSTASWLAFWHTAVDGLSGKQAAEELGLSVAAVYHARGRVLSRLKELVRSAQEP